MATVPRRSTVSFDEFCILIPPDQKADLIDGVIFMASPEHLRAHRLYGWLYRLLGDCVEHMDLGEIFGSRVAFRMGDRQGPEPDLAFVAKARLHLCHENFVAGSPDGAIEIVSPESVQRDYIAKRSLYEAGGVREYWIIDELHKEVVLLRLDGKGRFREIKPARGVLRSKVVDGFWLRTAWLWQNPRPGRAQVLEEILSE